MDQIEDVKTKNDKTSARPPDRVAIGKEESEKVTSWINQVTRTCGFLHLTRSDVLNFLIRSRNADLSTKEINQLRAAFYDPVRHLNWIMPRLKEALESGEMEKVSQIQSEIRGIELSITSKASSNISSDNGSPKKVRKQREAKVSGPDREPTVAQDFKPED